MYQVIKWKIFQKLGYKNTLQNLYTLDTTEIDGTDNLHNAKEIIKYSQERAARVFNSDRVIYLVNGTTCGIRSNYGSLYSKIQANYE